MQVKCVILSRGWAVTAVVSYIWSVTSTVYCDGNLCTLQSTCFFGAVDFCFSGLYRDGVCI